MACNMCPVHVCFIICHLESLLNCTVRYMVDILRFRWFFPVSLFPTMPGSRRGRRIEIRLKQPSDAQPELCWAPPPRAAARQQPWCLEQRDALLSVPFLHSKNTRSTSRTRRKGTGRWLSISGQTEETTGHCLPWWSPHTPPAFFFLFSPLLNVPWQKNVSLESRR